MITFENEYKNIPENIQGSISRYVEHHVKPGSFLTAVLCNDLYNATGRADENSLKALHLIVMWFANNRPDLYGHDNFVKHISHNL
jgi:hypothetical protein